MDEATHTSLHASLDTHRANLRREIEALGADPDSDETAIADDRGFADSAHSTAERSRLLSLLTALRANLEDVQHAIAKLDAGAYGTCERCGRPIGADRLEALPWAALCIDCKQRGARV
jgi:RNA polymerase-binding protein DksA